MNLMPLRVPAGWLVAKNHFADEIPRVENDRIANETYFNEDLLSMEQTVYTPAGWKADPAGFCVDLGWQPEADPGGAYRLVIFRGDWDHVAYRFRSTDRQLIANIINRCLWYVNLGMAFDKINERLTEEFGPSL
jgi:hypothetical protein